MAAALLTRHLDGRGATASVRSAGMLGEGLPPPREAVSVLAGYGLDIGSHRSRPATAADLTAADLTLAMAREQLRHAVVTAPAAWPRAFTLKELVRRGGQIGPRSPGEPIAGWLSRAHDGRERSALLGACADDDVADPMGGPQRAYAETAGVLDQLAGRLAWLCWPSAGP